MMNHINLLPAFDVNCEWTNININTNYVLIQETIHHLAIYVLIQMSYIYYLLKIQLLPIPLSLILSYIIFSQNEQSFYLSISV